MKINIPKEWSRQAAAREAKLPVPCPYTASAVEQALRKARRYDEAVAIEIEREVRTLHVNREMIRGRT